MKLYRLGVVLLGLTSSAVAAQKTILVRDPLNLYDTLVQDRTEYLSRPDFGRNVTFSPDDFSSSSGTNSFCRQLRVVTQGDDIEEACTVYDNRGHIITDYSQLQENVSISVVPASLPFIWQSNQVGETLFVEGGPREQLIELETLSLEPRVYRIRNLLTEEEVDGFVKFAKTQKMERSTVGEVVKGATGQNLGVQDSDRTSENTWDTDSILATTVQRRVFDLLRVPYNRDWADGFQILHYTPGKFYNSHEDWFGAQDSAKQHRNFEPSLGGANRFATLFLYLSTVELGGETVFPLGPDVVEDMSTRARAEALRDELVTNGTIRKGGLEWNLFDTCRRKLHTKPVKGEVILFYNMDSRGVLDAKAQHGACAPLTEDKWGANLWIWNGPFHIDEARTADFVNSLDEKVDVYWRSDTGEEVFLDSMEPGGSYQSFTFVGHTFIVKGQSESWTFVVADEPEKQEFVIPTDNSDMKEEL